MHILVVNGPNMNMLGIRQPEIYGHETYEDLKALIRAEADRLGASVSFFQSNHEGALVDAIQQAYFDHVDGIIINPAAYTHTSVALLDAVKAVGIPTVEVHVSDPDSGRSSAVSPTSGPPARPPSGAMGSRDMWRPCGFSAARTLDKRRSLTDNMPIPHWVSGRCRHETMYGCGQPAPAAEEDRRPGAGY